MKERIKKTISKYNPLAIRRRSRMRNSLTNQLPSLLCPNCMGGILFHDLGIRFQSPTFNLMIYQDDFIRFITNLKHYLNQKLVFYNDPEYLCPCAYLDDIIIHFTHYQDVGMCEKKWIERCGRIHPDNTFVFLTERDGITYEDIKNLQKLEYKGIVVFTAHEYKDVPYAVFIPEFEDDGEVGNILERSIIDDSRRYEKYFDFVKWFNESSGKPYDVKNFIR